MYTQIRLLLNLYDHVSTVCHLEKVCLSCQNASLFFCVWLGKLTLLDMTPLDWLGHKTSSQKKQNKYVTYCYSFSKASFKYLC